MPYEQETEYSSAYYRCIDPIENFKIKVVLKPVKNLYIPLPQFDVEQSSNDISSSQGQNELEIEEYSFKWQEKVFSGSEIKKYSTEADWKKKLSEKYHLNVNDKLKGLKNYQNKIFSYTEPDNYSASESKLDIFTEKTTFVSSLCKKINGLIIPGPNVKYKNFPRKKIINYCPSQDFKTQAHLINNNIQKMFIMVDLGSKALGTDESEEQEHYEAVLCCLAYDYSTSVLQVTPAFSKRESKPYTTGIENENRKNFYYYWIYHASPSINSENLTSEIQLMSKVFDYQEEVKKLQIDTDFFVGKPDHIYITLLGEIVHGQDFEYDNLHIYYFVKLPPSWKYNDINSLSGRTQSCCKNSQGILYFSHLFEMDFCVEINSFKDPSAAPLELFFEVLSVDNYKRYRNEGYTYATLPKSPGMYKYSLRCWRISDQTIMSQLERFFIGGGPELEDVSYVGFSNSEKPEIMNRFGLGTIPSGLIEVKLNFLQQSKSIATKKGEPAELEKSISSRVDAGSLLGSVNAVLEAFRKARERMLQAKMELQTNLTYTAPVVQKNIKQSD